MQKSPKISRVQNSYWVHYDRLVSMFSLREMLLPTSSHSNKLISRAGPQTSSEVKKERACAVNR